MFLRERSLRPLLLSLLLLWSESDWIPVRLLLDQPLWPQEMMHLCWSKHCLFLPIINHPTASPIMADWKSYTSHQIRWAWKRDFSHMLQVSSKVLLVYFTIYLSRSAIVFMKSRVDLLFVSLSAELIRLQGFHHLRNVKLQTFPGAQEISTADSRTIDWKPTTVIDSRPRVEYRQQFRSLQKLISYEILLN